MAMKRKRTNGAPPIPNDVMAVVLQHCVNSPRHIFLTLKASKGLRALLDGKWWDAFWEKHMAYIHNRGPVKHWFLRPNAFPTLRPAQYSHILRLVYGLRCEMCGCR